MNFLHVPKTLMTPKQLNQTITNNPIKTLLLHFHWLLLYDCSHILVKRGKFYCVKVFELKAKNPSSLFIYVYLVQCNLILVCDLYDIVDSFFPYLPMLLIPSRLDHFIASRSSLTSCMFSSSLVLPQANWSTYIC